MVEKVTPTHPHLFLLSSWGNISVPVLLGYGLGIQKNWGEKTHGFGWVFKFRKTTRVPTSPSLKPKISDEHKLSFVVLETKVSLTTRNSVREFCLK